MDLVLKGAPLESSSGESWSPCSSVWLCPPPPPQVTSLAWCSVPLTTKPTRTTCANTSLGPPTDVPVILTLAQRPSGEALPAPSTYGGAQELGWKGGALLHCFRHRVEEGAGGALHTRRQLYLREAVKGPEHEAQ